MYGVPERERLVGLIGKELVQVCFGVHQVIFRFEKDVWISVESGIENSMLGRVTGGHCEIYRTESFLVGLLGSTLREVDRVNSKTLRLTFSNDCYVDLRDDSDHYESFQIKVDGELIVI